MSFNFYLPAKFLAIFLFGFSLSMITSGFKND
jgi:hypothetical protein